MYSYELLEQLYKLHSPSGKEKKMARLMTRLCKERGATVTQDKTGNLFVTKGNADTYPCICAHMDQVQLSHPKDFTVLRQGDIIYAFSEKAKGPQGLGADDKNGLWIALELLDQLDVLKCAFFVGEEIGCVGSRACDLAFLKDVRFCVQPDRRNGNDLITSIFGKLCSEDFIKAINYKKFGYKTTSGLTTDVGTLVSRGIGVSCVNISCGYYEPHTDNEVTSWKELCNALDFAKHICSLTDTYPHKYEYPSFGWGSYDARDRGFGYGWGGYGYNYGNSRYAQWGHSRKVYQQQKPVEPVTHEPIKFERTRPEADMRTCDDDEYDDRLSMSAILEFDPSTTFEEVCKYYMGNFITKDTDLLHNIYDDAHAEVTVGYMQ